MFSLNLNMRLLAVGIGIAIGWYANYYYHLPKCPEPLKVAILNDGGAHLQTSSTVETKGCRK